ncbi:MAG: FAD-linked oxidase C-terminal domain-containing protein [Gammaproteobacteria bacterium]
MPPAPQAWTSRQIPTDPDLIAALRAHVGAGRVIIDPAERTLDLFDELGVASNQLGRTYRYYNNLAPETRALLEALKAALDPQGLMNPGVLAAIPG